MQALGLFRRYLLTEHQCVRFDQITPEQICGWFTALPLMSTAIGALRSPGTVGSYARSARAFCQWLVRHRYLPATPFAHVLLPQVENRLLRSLEPEEWERLLLACHLPKETGVLADQATARNRAILWVLFDTGMQATEVCRLRLCDVDREQGTVRVQGKGSQQRRLTLGQEGQRYLLAYLDWYRLKLPRQVEHGDATSEWILNLTFFVSLKLSLFYRIEDSFWCLNSMFLATTQYLIHSCSQDSSYEKTNPVDPYHSECISSSEESRC